MFGINFAVFVGMPESEEEPTVQANKKLKMESVGLLVFSSSESRLTVMLSPAYFARTSDAVRAAFLDKVARSVGRRCFYKAASCCRSSVLKL